MTDWRDRALCAGMPTDVFFQPEPQGRGDRKNGPDPHAEARAVCAACPVINECLTWAMENNEYGFLGGMTERERAALKRKQQRGQQRDSSGRSFMLTPLEFERRMDAYGRGLSDNEASAELGIDRSTWRSWRIGNTLPANKPNPRAVPLPAWVHELRMSLYKSGLTDREIATGAKCSTDAVKNWRAKRGLPRNQQPVNA